MSEFEKKTRKLERYWKNNEKKYGFSHEGFCLYCGHELTEDDKAKFKGYCELCFKFLTGKIEDSEYWSEFEKRRNRKC